MSEMREPKRRRESEREEVAGQNRTSRARTRRKRSPKQQLRQIDVYRRHLAGETIDAIAIDLKVNRKTIMLDLKVEGELRAEELGDRRSTEIARAVDFYTDIIRRCLERAEVSDEILVKIRDNYAFEGRVSDRSLQEALNARERIDKVLGVEAAVKIDVGMQPLLAALDK
jgi:hypothetical protein